MNEIPTLQLNELTRRIIGMAMEIHTELGPGLLESVYETFLFEELRATRISVERQKHCAVSYKGRTIPSGYRIDLLVEGRLIVECKAVENLLPLHRAQLLTYLRLSGLKLGLILNFNSVRMKDGITRIVNGLTE